MPELPAKPGSHENLLDWRGIDLEDACGGCAGAGIKVYGSTATWRGGIGGRALTSDVCNECWGSGNKHKPWPSHRAKGVRVIMTGDIVSRLLDAAISSCSCATKTPAVEYHKPDCRYRVIQDAITEINNLREAKE